MIPKLDEAFEHEGVSLKCIKQAGCHGCHFEHALICKCYEFNCAFYERPDETDVIFIKQKI